MKTRKEISLWDSVTGNRVSFSRHFRVLGKKHIDTDSSVQALKRTAKHRIRHKTKIMLDDKFNIAALGNVQSF